MSVCTNCRGELDDDNLLAGSDVYGELASGNDREDLLGTYSGIRYGRETVLCAACLDSPADCRECDGTGELRPDGAGDGVTEPCPECDGTGTTKPDLLRTCCK